MTHQSRAWALLTLGGVAMLCVAIAGCAGAGGSAPTVKPIPEAAALAAEKARAPSLTASNFLPDASRMAPNDALPFARSWINRSTDFTRYSAVVIAPVSLAYLRPVPAKQKSAVDAQARQEAALQTAIRVSDSFAKAVAHLHGSKLTLDRNARPGAVVVQMALVQLIPSRPAPGALQPAMQPTRGPASSGTGRSAAVEPGSIAMETILRDGGSDKVVAMFSDERSAEIAPTDLTAPTKYGFTDRIVDQWADEIVRVITSTVAGVPPHINP
jgi:Protein of unknown function (DUF3313)